MEWNCKDRWRCNINKKRLIFSLFSRLFFCLISIIIFSLLNVKFIDKRLNSIFNDYLDIEVKKICNNIISKSVYNYISKEKYDDFIEFKYSSDDTIERISYNTENINKFTSDFSKYLDKILLSIDSGSIENYSFNKRLNQYSFIAINDGLLCNIALGSINKSTLFSGLGPKIPIKISFSGNFNTDIDIKVEEYGINNALIKVYFVINVKEQAILPLTSKENNIVIRELISADIIKGNIPGYYGNFVNWYLSWYNIFEVDIYDKENWN